MLVAPVLGCARLGWSFARLTRGWLASSAFAVLGATPALLLTTSGFGVASPLWMLVGAGAGAVFGLALAERATGHGFGPARSLLLSALAFAASATLTLALRALLDTGAFATTALGLAVVSPTTFGYAVAKPLGYPS